MVQPSTAAKLEAEAEISTFFGDFTVRGYSSGEGNAVALVRGDIHSIQRPLVRIHSACLFGECFHAVTCDCHWQIVGSLHRLHSENCGVFIYLFQEGRGIGIFEKIKAYAIQQKYHCDTVEAFRRLNLQRSDFRTYQLAAAVLRALELSSVCLLTNNDAKVRAMTENGIDAVRESLAMDSNDLMQIDDLVGNEKTARLLEYLLSKEQKLKHDLGAQALRAKRQPN
jgi:3,4-dihydroxy 2-butanone 4-phosphate synthase/GTP cyclohydrolase II